MISPKKALKDAKHALREKSASRPKPVPMKWRCAWPEADRKFLW
jgi:hypothetical protein